MLENSLFGKLLITFLISAVPIIELRGAIPFAVAHGLPLQMAYAVAVLGNLLPVPFIMLFARKVFEIIRAHAKRLDAWVSKMEDRAIRRLACFCLWQVRCRVRAHGRAPLLRQC